MGLKQMGLHARGLLTDDLGFDERAPASSTSVSKLRPKRARESLSASVRLGRSELERQTEEILLDREHVEVRRVCLRSW